LSGGYGVTSRDVYTEYCNESWYKILFLYANLQLDGAHPEALNCMGHLWYIQVDFQMFLLLPWILLVFANNKTWGVITAAVPVFISTLIRIIYAFHYDFVANQLYPGYPPKNGGVQDQDSYFKPWTRMSVYFIGVAAMLIFIMIDEAYKNSRFVLSKVQYFVCIMFSCFIFAALVFWPYSDVKNAPEERWSLLSNQMYYALSKLAWGFAMALLCFALKYKSDEQRSIIKAILSLEVYQPLGKLTYLMYLLHLIIFAWWALDLEQPPYYTEWSEVLLVIGVWAITAFLSVILWLFMEKPITNLVNAFLKCLTTGKRRKVGDKSEDLLEKSSAISSIAGSKRDGSWVQENDHTMKQSMTDKFDESLRKTNR